MSQALPWSNVVAIIAVCAMFAVIVWAWTTE